MLELILWSRKKYLHKKPSIFRRASYLMKLQGESRTQIRITILGIVPVDIGTIRIGVAHIDKVAVSSPLSLLFSLYSLADLLRLLRISAVYFFVSTPKRDLIKKKASSFVTTFLVSLLTTSSSKDSGTYKKRGSLFLPFLHYHKIRETERSLLTVDCSYF